MTRQSDMIAAGPGAQGHADCQAKFVYEAANGHETRQCTSTFFIQVKGTGCLLLVGECVLVTTFIKVQFMFFLIGFAVVLDEALFSVSFAMQMQG